MNLTAADFVGAWRITREITDFRLHESGVLEGEASFSESETGLLYHERGTLRFAGGAPLVAERRYQWVFGANEVAVNYADGSAFHSFVPTGSPVAKPHLCGEDLYNGSYSFAAFPAWQVTWSVEGPRKNYRSVTHYSRD